MLQKARTKLMKKILSILVMVLFGVSSVWAQTPTGQHTLKAYSIVEGGDCNGSTIGGTVAVQGCEVYEDGTFIKTEKTRLTAITNPPAATATASIDEYIGKYNKAYVKFKLYAYPALGYYFTGWYDACSGGTLKYENAEQEVDYGGTLGFGATALGTTSQLLQFYSKFAPVSVTGTTTPTASISTIGLGGKGKTTITFQVANADEMGDFLYSFSNSTGFEVISENYSSNTVTLEVQYTDQNKHGTAIATTELTLKSRGDANSKATATITASSDLTPTFTKPGDYDFGTIYAGDTKGSGTALYVTNKNNVASSSNTQWSVSITGAGEGAYTWSNPNLNGDFVVTFRPTTAGTYNAILNIKASYTDAVGTTIHSTETQTALKGIAETPIESAIEFTPASWNFGNVVTGYTGTTEIMVSQQNVSNVTYSFGATNAEGVFSFVESAGAVTIVAAPNVPGVHTSTLTATGNDTRSGHEGEQTTGALTLSITVGLQAPVLVGGSNLKDTHYLKWTKVPCATSYEIYESDRTTLVASSEVANDETHITHSIASTAAEKTYIVKAISTYNGGDYESWSNEVTVKLSDIAVAGTPYLDIYSGTETVSTTFPYMTKWKVDLSTTFDVNGNALFDRLYIFGLTISSDGTNTISKPTATAPSTAITPCYIYTKNASGNGYTLSSTIDNMNLNAVNRPIPSITANSTTQRLFFTGFCPYASNGSGANQKGVIHIAGGAGTTIDVYMDDLYLFARNHTQGGYTKELKNDSITMDLALWQTKYVSASASAFVFESTSTNSNSPFAPNIHLRDSSKLEGGKGAIFATLVGQTASAGLHSAPIHLFVSEGDHAISLSIDDKWLVDATDIAKTERTNGAINLVPLSSGRPCIELGNGNSTVNFNGGQIYLKNSLPTSANYLCTFAIGHRAYTKSVSVVNATLSGVGNDQGDGIVNFNDGSIYCKELTTSEMGKYSGYYRTETSMKCPQNTYINGGTYNCDIWACSEAANLGASPKNKYYNPLVTARFHINNIPVAPYYLATVNFDSIANVLVCQDNSHSDYTKTMAQYYNGKDTYGRNSLKADATDSVTLMLPYQFTGKGFEQEEDVTNWAVCMPTLESGSDVGGGYSATFGGPVEVSSGELRHTRYLFYSEIDSKTMDIANDEHKHQSAEIPNLGSVSIAFKELRQNVTNTTSYQIDEAQYMIVPIKSADEWILFCPPYDITNVYVVEAYPEDELRNISDTVGNMDGAFEEQSKAVVDLFFYMGYDISFNQTNADFWTIYRKWKTDKTIKTGAGAIKLTHFTGSNYDANYYLQRSSGTWEWNGSKFITDWKYLPNVDDKTAEGYNDYYKATHGDTEYNVVMKKGEIYSMKFPHMYYGYRDEEGKWDYWTGKYLIFEGLGLQTIEGKDFHANTLLAANNVVAGTAEIRGNSTLSEIEISGMEAYYLNDNQKFTRSLEDNKPEAILPSGGFVLANDPATPSPMPRRIASIDMMTGDVTLEGGDGTATGTPTIAGNNKMLVYNINGGVGVVPVVAQQVSVYNAAGQLVTSEYLTGETNIPLPAGIYLVCGEHEQFKVLVK